MATLTFIKGNFKRQKSTNLRFEFALLPCDRTDTWRLRWFCFHERRSPYSSLVIGPSASMRNLAGSRSNRGKWEVPCGKWILGLLFFPSTNRCPLTPFTRLAVRHTDLWVQSSCFSVFKLCISPFNALNPKLDKNTKSVGFHQRVYIKHCGPMASYGQLWTTMHICQFSIRFYVHIYRMAGLVFVMLTIRDQYCSHYKHTAVNRTDVVLSLSE